MKKITSLLAALGLLIQALIIPTAGLASVVAVSGCKTSQTTVAHKSMQALNTAVKTALDVWAEYVAAKRESIASITNEEARDKATASLDAKEAKARLALDSYKSAFAAARPAVEAALKSQVAPAPFDVLKAGTAFTETVSELTK